MEPAILFALQASRSFGERVARAAGLALSPLEERDFEDGEHKSRPLIDVHGRDCYLLQSLYSGAEQSVNDKLCRLLFFIGCLKDGGAASVTVLIPYLAYARKDRRTKPHDPITTRYMAQLLEAVGSDRVVVMDVHNPAAFENAFRCPTVHLEARALFIERILKQPDADAIAVLSPDSGGVKRADRLRQGLERQSGNEPPLAFMAKRRSGGRMGGDERVVGEVGGMDVLIIDDLISTGGTLVRAARACREAGARSVRAAATHGVFAPGAEQALADPVLDAIWIADTVAPWRLESTQAQTRLEVLPAAPLFGQALKRLHAGESLIDLIEF